MSNRQILIVDDEPPLQRMLSEALTLEGYQVEIATNGQEAIQKLEQAPNVQRVMLLDLIMPGIDGWGVLRWMEEHPANRANTKIILMSANERLSTVLDSQVEAKLAKPFGIDGLLAILGQYV